MTLSDISVRRPVLAAVMSLLIVIFGLAALWGLPVRQLPDVDNAVVTVTTTSSIFIAVKLISVSRRWTIIPQIIR